MVENKILGTSPKWMIELYAYDSEVSCLNTLIYEDSMRSQEPNSWMEVKKNELS